MTEDADALPGGHMGRVVRERDTVRREAGPWTPRIHDLMRDLRVAGLEFVPEPRGLDDLGREVVQFIPGEVGVYPMPEWIWRDDLLVDVAKTMRRLHDVTRGMAKPATRWRREPVEPSEVICHSDVAPYNVVCREGRLVALIDWDFAIPAPTGWDLGYAAYRWISLTGPDHPDGRQAPVSEQRRRLDLFCTAYGDVESADVLEWAVHRLDDLIAYSRAQAADGNPNFAATIAAGHVALYERDAEWIRSTYL